MALNGKSMNKKGTIVNLVIRIFAICIMICLVYFMFIYVPLRTKSEVRACKELGFENHVSNWKMNHCEDEEGNLYYVKMECDEYFVPVDCKAKQIKVGGKDGT